MKIAIGEFKVTIYYEPNCGRHDWALKDVPVAECPYYLSLVHEDESEHEKYVAVAKRRHPNWEKDKTNTYGSLMRLAFSIAKDGYLPAKAEAKPMTVWRGSTLLKEGHHRAAVLRVLRMPQDYVEVSVADEEAPIHKDPCEG